MNRITVECLLKAYAGALVSAVATAQCDESRGALKTHLRATQNMLARWRGGESEAALKAALQTEMQLYQNESLDSPEVNVVTRAFRHCCRALGVTMIDSGVPVFAPSPEPPARAAPARCDDPQG